MKISVDKELCTGCELCADICPDIFEMQGETAEAYANNDPVPEDMQDCAREVSDSCPAGAIPITE